MDLAEAMLRRIALVLLFCLATNDAFGAVAFRSGFGSTYASRTNNVLTAPAGIQNGDILIICFLIFNGSSSPPTPTPPAGFVVVPGPTFPVNGGTSSLHVHNFIWFKVASSESGNYTVTHTVATSQAWIGAYSGGNQSTPMVPNATSNTGTGTTTTALGLTTTINGSGIIFVAQDFGDNNNNLTAPSGTTPTFTKEFGATVGNGSGGILFIADGALSPAGSTGNKTFTSNSNSTSPWAGFLVTIAASPPANCGRLALLGVGC